MKRSPAGLFDLYVLTALAKGFPVFCSVLLPVFYAEKLLTAKGLGYIGALFIGMTITGALVVARWLHGLNTRRLLQLAAWGTIGGSALLFAGMASRNILLLVLAYALVGTAAGTAMSGVNALVASTTTRGDRFKSIAKLSMAADAARLVFPAAIAGLVAIGASKAAALVILAAAFVFLRFVSRQAAVDPPAVTALAGGSMWRNRPFKFVLSLEFLDSFASSQLFVFLPLLFLAKGHSLQSSLLLQTFLFMGYMSGRWLVSVVAKRSSGLRAVGIAELGQVAAVLLLLVVQPLWVLYVLSFMLGIFARGTSPAIKSLAFDSLDDSQMKRGSAVHVVAGDSGSALGQLLFGLFVAWYGVRTPFLAAAGVAAVIALLCIPRLSKLLSGR